MGSFLEPHGRAHRRDPGGGSTSCCFSLWGSRSTGSIGRRFADPPCLRRARLPSRLVRRVSPALAAIAAISILTLGSAWQNLLWPSRSGFSPRSPRGWRLSWCSTGRGRYRDLAATALIAVSLASSSIGIPLRSRRGGGALSAPGAVAAPLDRRSTARSLLRLVPRLRQGRSHPSNGQGRHRTGRFEPASGPGVHRGLPRGLVRRLLGLGLEWGRSLAIIAIGGFAVWALRPRPFSPAAMLLLVTAATYWGLAGLFRAHLGEPTASRYVYLGAVLIVLVAVELARGAVTTPRVLAVLGLLAAFAVANFNQLRAGSGGLQDNSGYVSAELGALELTRSTVDPGTASMPRARQGLRRGVLRRGRRPWIARRQPGGDRRMARAGPAGRGCRSRAGPERTDRRARLCAPAPRPPSTRASTVVSARRGDA